MNKLYSLILLSFISIAAFAAERPKSGRLTITTHDNADIRVEIDGRRYSNNDNTIRISNINSGYHSIQVYRRQRALAHDASGPDTGSTGPDAGNAASADSTSSATEG